MSNPTQEVIDSLNFELGVDAYWDDENFKTVFELPVEEHLGWLTAESEVMNHPAKFTKYSALGVVAH